ncbi:MAG: hypothetical protein Q9217_004894 [Psora testacea]
MVFNKFTHLARPSLSKTFVHGYAQSVVAATQSTGPFPPLGKHQSHKSGRPSTSQLHTPFSTASNAAAATGKASYPSTGSTQHSDGGLVAYYDAWQKLEQHGGELTEWRQFQFPKLIEARAPPKVQGGKGTEQDITSRAKEPVDHGSLDRAYSTSAIDEIKNAQDVEEAAAVAKVDEAIATVIDDIKQRSVAQDATPSITTPTRQQMTQVTTEPSASPTTESLDARAEASTPSTPLTDATAATSIEDLDSHAFSQHLSKLQDALAYKEIPPAFESMLARGVKPTAQAYNALLASAIHLPMGKHQVIPKVLDIYSDMLRRKVSPDSAFCSTLIQTLSRRALDVADMKEDMENRRKRFNGINETGSFLFASNEAEYGILAEDDALSNAMTLFGTATSTLKTCPFPTETYNLLILACARHHRVDDMVEIYHHLESQHVKPVATIFPAMIVAFAKDGDLSSAVECYNEYRILAIADDSGKFAILGRNDSDVYAALIRAYALCGKADGGKRFYSRVIDSFATDTEERRQQLEQIKDTVQVEAFVQDRLDFRDFAAALAIAEGNQMTPHAREQAFSKICSAAADNADIELANKAYEHLPWDSMARPAASLAIFALHVREKQLEAASEHWAELTSRTIPDASLVEPTVSFAIGLIRNSQVDKASVLLRETFARIRNSEPAACSSADVADQMDESIEVIAKLLVESRTPTSAISSLNFLWAMVENGGLISSIAEQMLASLAPEDIASLGWQDMIFALQVEAGLIGSETVLRDASHISRFAHLLDLAINPSVALDEKTLGLVETAMNQLSERTDLVDKWQKYKQSLLQPTHHSFTPLPGPPVRPSTTLVANYDPYAATTDYRGSAIIIEELENHRNSLGLSEALIRFRNIRRGGRHPRYIAYARLITAASKEGRINLTHDILGMARRDMPFLPAYPVIQQGWSSILDAMVGACLIAGRRSLAEQFHQELLDMGSTLTANTYGLYITTLKESTKTFDEATEAVKIFHRAITEGVLPSSFLYNALIGKLGKARRIDDCLRYFQEMRASGIHPTSVTYGTIVNALCRVSEERFAEELFDEMESMPNYKPRPAPYNSLMQYFLMTKRDSKKVLAYYDRMQVMKIQPTMHTYKLLIDTHATLEPVNLAAAEGVLDTIRASGLRPEAVHYASLIHAKGCALHDMAGARQVFDEVLASGEVKPQACLYQALFESMVANHCVAATEEVLDSMSANRVEMTPYIANTLIHGWALEHQIAKSKAIYDSVGMEKREPSTYESMTRAFLTAQDRKGALAIVHEMLSRGYPSAVSSKVLELLGHGMSRAGNVILSELIA